MDAIFEWFSKGGFFMWPLLLCSVIGLAVICERSFAHARIFVASRKLDRNLRQAVVEAEQLPSWYCRSLCPAARICHTFREYRDHTSSLRNKALKREGDRVLCECVRNLKLLGTIGHIAPLIGLLGTVTGLVAAFYRIEQLGGRVQPHDLAGGIWEALITTVAGLSVGIVCLVAHRFFQSRADGAARDVSILVSELDEALEERQERLMLQGEPA